MKLKNLMEDIVLRSIEDFWKDVEMCKCERCKLDAAGIALNKLPPRYVVTDRGESYAKTDILEIQKYVDLVTVINRALAVVKKSPNH